MIQDELIHGDLSDPSLKPGSRFQHITDNNDIVNHSDLGNDIKSFTSDPNNYIFPGGHGFLDGGCYAFALALEDWYKEGELAVVVRDDTPERIQHFVLQIKYDDEIAYLDGDGLSLDFEMKNKMMVLEGLNAISILTLAKHEVRHGKFDQDESMILTYSEIGIPEELAKRLNRTININEFQGVSPC